MKQLETTFELDDNRFTQLKRSASAAIYKRETMEGNLVSYEVFAVKSKNGVEVYPQKHAFGKWAWCPISLDKAEIYFDRIDSSETVIPDVDPETSEVVRDEVEVSLDDMPDVNVEGQVSVQTTADAPVVVSLESVEAGEDPTVPDEVVVEPVAEVVPEVNTEVQPTPDGGAVVTVAKVKKEKVEMVFIIPKGEFTQAQFAVANGLPERGVVWSRLDSLVKAGKLNKALVKMGKGRPTQVFTEVV